MGCGASKLYNEDPVRRCKERRRLMKEALHARHLLAAAHADYCLSLRVTGSALSSFAAGEPLSVSEQSSAVLLRSPSSHTSHFHPDPPSPSPSLHPPPPPPHSAPAAGDQAKKLEIGSSSAAAETLSVSDQSPAVLVHSPNSHPSHVRPVPPSPSPSLHPSPPPPHSANASSHRSLKEIVDAIKKNFDKVAEAGDEVSKELEIGPAQKTVYHSSSVLNNLSSSWTSKPPLAAKYRLDTAAMDEPGDLKSLCSTLDLLLAWERKLYEEVKAREGAKIEHDKTLSALQSQEYKGGNETKLDKTKASIKRLHSLITVNSQFVSITSTSIIGLRDSDLVPQLADLSHGYKNMWRSMHQFHEDQSHILQQVDLVNRSGNGDSTSELHRQATRELESAVSAWHSSFCRLIKFQSDFIRSIHDWFRLTLISLTNDNVDGNGQPPTVLDFINQWKLALDQVPHTVASEAIKSFTNVVHEISVQQTKELKIKKRTKTVSKELVKKASSLRSIERKLCNSYPIGGTSVPETGSDNGQVSDAQDPHADKKSELAACQKRMEDEILKLSKAVEDKVVEVTRSVALKNLQTGLSRVFQELIRFSVSFSGHLTEFPPRP